MRAPRLVLVLLACLLCLVSLPAGDRGGDGGGGWITIPRISSPSDPRIQMTMPISQGITLRLPAAARQGLVCLSASGQTWACTVVQTGVFSMPASQLQAVANAGVQRLQLRIYVPGMDLLEGSIVIDPNLQSVRLVIR